MPYLRDSFCTFFAGRSILEATAKQLDVTPTVATTYSQTRFASSSYVQWQRIVKSFKLFATSLKNATPTATDELHPLQYQVLEQVRIWLFHFLIKVNIPPTFIQANTNHIFCRGHTSVTEQWPNVHTPTSLFWKRFIVWSQYIARPPPSLYGSRRCIIPLQKNSGKF